MAISTWRSSSQALCRLDLVLNLGLLVEQFFHFVGFDRLAQPGVDLVEAAEDFADGLDGFLDVAEDVAVGIQLRLLRQIAGREAGKEAGLALEFRVQAGHDPQQRALAGSVLPQHADLGAGIEGQTDVFEDFPLAELFGQAGDLIDELSHP